MIYCEKLNELAGLIEKHDKNHSLLLTANGIFCRECSANYKHSNYQGKYAKYITEPAIPTEDDLKKHLDCVRTDRHKKAYDAISQLVYADDSNFGDKFSSATRALRKRKNDIDKLEKALLEKVRIIHWMVREMVANFKYKSLQSLINDVGNNPELAKVNHNSNFSFLEFLEGINLALKDAFLQDLSSISEYSILLDECKDIEGIYQVAFWITYLDRSSVRQMKFLSLVEANSQGCTGVVLFDMLMKVLNEYGLDINNMGGIGTDGASVMVGNGEGLRGRIHEVAPWVCAIHCAAHRLHLAAGDMLKPAEFKQLLEAQDVVRDAANFIHGGNRGAYFFELQVQRGGKAYALPRPNDTRWWSMHKLIKTFIARYGAIVEGFNKWKSSSEEGKRIYEIITTYKFIVNLCSLEIVMNCMKPLSLELQKSNLTVLQLYPALKATYDALDYAVRNKIVRRLVHSMLKQTGHYCQWGHYTVISLTMDFVTARFVENSKRCIQARFPRVELLEDLDVVFNPDKLRKARELPGTEYEDRYGDLEWERAVNEFWPHTGLSKDSNEYRDLIRNWHSVKVAIKWNLRASLRNADDVCKWILLNDRFKRTDPKDYCLAYTALMLARITLILPPTNAGVERGFSTMNDIKRPTRSRLSESVLNMLMFIRLHSGDSLEPSVVSDAVANWKAVRSRRGLAVVGVDELEHLERKMKYVQESKLDEVLADIKDRVEEEKVERIAE